MPNIIRFGVSGNWTPSIFGDGRDGDAVISGTVSLPVTVPHQSIVEKQYKSLTVNAGATLKCADYNAGLILRVKGDCIIHGTIDQSGKAPKTNPQNNYPYPAQLRCGNGGNGGNGAGSSYPGGAGGYAMLSRPYGGGYGAGGASGSSSDYAGIHGGNATSITVSTSNLFVCGSGGKAGTINNDGKGGPGSQGINGGGSGGPGTDMYGSSTAGGSGGNGGGLNDINGKDGIPPNYSGDMSGGGGGSGNFGGGVILLYVGGSLSIDGQIKCNGHQGGNGGKFGQLNVVEIYAGGGGGGGGGGAIYICHKGIYTNSGVLQVNGGAGGIGAASGSAGSIGSITVVQWTKDMEA